jgi:5-methylcytosine-specific restriction endonuclease McrA
MSGAQQRANYAARRRMLGKPLMRKRVRNETEAECTKCKEIKPLDRFTRQRVSGKWGPHPWCRECRRPGLRALKSRRRKALGVHTAAEVREIWRLQRGRCAICGKKLLSGYHVDHITPLAGGGENGRHNLQLTHGECNRRKGAKDPIAHRQQAGFLI